MINHNLCMGCMADKHYEGSCRFCGYSDDSPYLPAYLSPGSLLSDNRYIVGKLFSYNGEGATYIAYDNVTGRKVVIKEFMPDTLCQRTKNQAVIQVSQKDYPLYKTYLSEFLELNKELMKSRGMNHLQGIYDIFSENNTGYIVYEYIIGISLKRFLANSAGELSWEQVKELFPPIFTTLSLIHSGGIIHRGLSPSTIFVTEKKELKLTGFAISAARTANTELAGEMFSGYAAPEQYSSNNWHGSWTDVYGISAVLYRVLTGCMPPEALGRVGNDNLLEPMMVNRNIPSNVSKVIMSGLKLSTDSRIQTVTEFVDKLFEQPRYNPPKTEKLAAKTSNLPKNGEKQKSAKGVKVDPKQAAKESKRKKERMVAIIGITVTVTIMISFIIALILTRLWEVDSGGKSSETSAFTTATTVRETTTFTVESEEVNVLTYVVPDLTNRSYEAEKTRYNDIMTLTPKYEFNDSHPKGLIYNQNIESGTTVNAGVEIIVYVSKGPKKISLPEFAGKKSDNYIEELSKLGIKFTVKELETDEVAVGYVVRTNKGVGDKINVEKAENVVVYKAVKPKKTSTSTTED